MPLARATGIGSTLDCADHSNSVCFLVRSTISWPVMAGTVVTVVIRLSSLIKKHLGTAALVSLPKLCRQRAFLFGNVSQRSFKHIQRLVHLRVGDDQRHEQANHVAVRSGGDR